MKGGRGLGGERDSMRAPHRLSDRSWPATRARVEAKLIVLWLGARCRLLLAGGRGLERQRARVDAVPLAGRLGAVVEDVPKVTAAESRSPRLRYVVPASAKPLILLLTSLPGRLADRAKQRALVAS